MFNCKNVFAQWYPDTPTPAELQARDNTYWVLQGEVEKTLVNNVWGLTPFQSGTEASDKRIILRGKSIHRFDVGRWDGDACSITLKTGTPQYDANMDSAKIINEKLDQVMNDISALMQETMQKLQKNGGKYVAPDRKRVEKDSLLKVRYMSAISHLTNEQRYGKIQMEINMDKEDGEGHGSSDYNTDSFVHLQLPGVRNAILRFDFPDKENPEMADTIFIAQLYIGNWKRIAANQRTDFVYKYNTKYYWADKTHSGPPIIENLVITIDTYHYNNMMHILKSIDWTKLDALVKK